MHRFFAPPPAASGELTFGTEQARQLAAVLRLRPGDRVVAFDGSGAEYVVRLDTVTRAAAQGTVEERRPGASEPTRDVHLYLALLKGEKLDWVVQKAVEIGVGRLVPVIALRCVSRSLSAARLDRLRRIAIEAAEQSGRTRVPEIAEPEPLEQALEAAPRPAALPWEGAAGQAAGLVTVAGSPALSLFVGPEGGFDPAEVELASEAGVEPVSLGRRILRAETAAIVALALALDRDGALD